VNVWCEDDYIGMKTGEVNVPSTFPVKMADHKISHVIMIFVVVDAYLLGCNTAWTCR
jgi:hypothetical protein